MHLADLNKKNTVKTISLFSGAGGLDVGAIQAGAQIIWANDMVYDACKTYSNNIGDHIKCDDLNNCFEELSFIKNVDLVIGGPPCQGFSVAGKMDKDDQRSQLVWSFLKVISIIKPKAFIMENVKALAQLKRWENVREELLFKFRDLGYSVNFIVLNASDFNVPQSRERVFFIGFKGHPNIIPNLEEMTICYKTKSKTVRQVLQSLDKAGCGNNINTCNAKITLAINPILRKSPYAGMIFNGLGRPLKLDGYSATLPASMGGNRTPIIDERELYENKKSWVEDYHSKLIKDVTIALRTSVPLYLRRLTIEEAALLQTFPIDYVFSGSQSSKYTQIGNAVPCNLAKSVAQMVIKVLEGEQKFIPIKENIQLTLNI